MKRGIFIALEGGEGAGKSTQARMLAETLQKRGIAAVTTREPGGTQGAEAIRDLLLGTDGDGWEPRAEALLFAAARSDHVARLVQPALQAGKWVICDRFVDSSRAYQGGHGGLTDDDILSLHDVGSRGLMPDLTLLLALSPDVASVRLAARDGSGTDRIGGRDAAFHSSVAERFAKMADAEADRFRCIDADGSPEAVHARIMNVVTPLIEANA